MQFLSTLLVLIQLSLIQSQTPSIVNNSTGNVCICVTSGSCIGSTTPGSNNGSGIDVRIVTNVQTPLTTSGSVFPVSSGINPQVNSQNVCQSGLDRCCLASGYQCGLNYPPINGAKAPAPGQASYGEYPWQAVLLTTSNNAYLGSGALIDQLNVMTAAHKVSAYLTNGQQLKVRLGEWDASSSVEPIPAQEYMVSRIFVHPQFNAATLRNSIAIIRLSSAVSLGSTPTIGTICLPSNPLSNMRCWVAGWGRNDFSSNGAYQAVMKEVDVPLVDLNTCQNQLRATRLGQNFQLDRTSFMCAGGEPGKDACTGDGGSPLVCNSGSRWFVMGIVAWGIGCGTSNVPGVYINVPNYISWIQSVTAS